MKKITIYSIMLFLMDIIIKKIIINKLEFNQSITLISNFFSITLVKNTGGAFSILNNNTMLLIIVSIILIIIIIFYLKKITPLSKINIIAFSLLIGGALGNLYDRIIHGYVIDYLDFNILSYHYPTFNLADSLIVIGTIMIIMFTTNKNTNIINIKRN